MAEVAGKRIHADALMRPGQAIQSFERPVGAAVVDEAHAPVDIRHVERARELGIEALDDCGLVVTGNDDREIGLKRTLARTLYHRTAPSRCYCAPVGTT